MREACNYKVVKTLLIKSKSQGRSSNVLQPTDLEKLLTTSLQVTWF